MGGRSCAPAPPATMFFKKACFKILTCPIHVSKNQPFHFFRWAFFANFPGKSAVKLRKAKNFNLFLRCIKSWQENRHHEKDATLILLSLAACGTAQASQTSQTQPHRPLFSLNAPGDPRHNCHPRQCRGAAVCKWGAATRAPTQEELNRFYERAYLSGDEFRGVLPDEDIIDIELIELSFIVSVENADLIAPENVKGSYQVWRAEAHPAAPVQAPTQTPATSRSQTVNRRSAINPRRPAALSKQG